MTLEPISEVDHEAPDGSKKSCFSCCSPAAASASTKKNEPAESAAAPVPAAMERGGGNSGSLGRPKMSRRQQSVYMSAFPILGEKELAALKEFEDAAMECMMTSNGNINSNVNESMYFDALDAMDGTPADLPYAPAQIADPRPRASVRMEDPRSLMLMMEELTEPRVNVKCAGYPGNLTENELAAAQQLREELKKRRKDVTNNGQTYEEVVRIYDPVETEPYALCRFLRARQFNVDKVIDMITEVLGVWREAQKHDYFPDPSDALGAPVNVFLTQLPSIYAGCAKNGCPVAYAVAADISVEGIECLIELDNIENYAWYAILHKFKKEIARAQEINPDVVRCETIQVVDLKGLNASVMNKRTLNTLQKLIVVNKCFPEVLNSMVIVNAPTFFSFFWTIIKTMLDPRTASKVAMFSKEEDGIKWMLERIDKSELLSDYGGTGDSFEVALNKQNVGTRAKRQIVKRFGITQRTNDKVDFWLDFGETAQFKAYTRSTTGASFELCLDGKTVTKCHVDGSPAMKPFSIELFKDVQGPGSFSIKSMGKSFNIDYFIVAGEVFDKF